ncbi:hypothetical protein BLA6993_04328 [Burkholderia lata]|nr:hypothetical protein BLA6993_04328 [Burkholderia lata]
MNGALPPSSSDSFFSVSADCFASSLPTRVEPVNDSLRTTDELVSVSPIATASPDTTLNTPAGTPARSASTASANADSGVSSDGFSTIVQPAASAGPALRVIIASGKFHGVIAATTPTGSRVTTICAFGFGLGITSPYMRFASSANHSRKLAAYATSPRASASGLPCSRVSSSASASRFSSISSPQRFTRAPRSFAVSARHAGNA